MSELAYRVAEQATGDQTVDEIATAVSTALRRPVSAVDVEALIDTILIPRGVVRAPNGYAHADDSTPTPMRLPRLTARRPPRCHRRAAREGVGTAPPRPASPAAPRASGSSARSRWRPSPRS